jgi:hypothetical protein
MSGPRRSAIVFRSALVYGGVQWWPARGAA